jgi:hypothetical protein
LHPAKDIAEESPSKGLHPHEGLQHQTGSLVLDPADTIVDGVLDGIRQANRRTISGRLRIWRLGVRIPRGAPLTSGFADSDSSVEVVPEVVRTLNSARFLGQMSCQLDHAAAAACAA